MYRFLLTPRWLGFGVLMLVAAAVMVMLGNWQLHRYHERDAINDRIDAAGRVAPAPLSAVLPAPGGAAGTAGAPPAGEAAWARVTVSGRYDSANGILARARTVEGRVGFEVITPLVLADGSAVLVDRGWVPPAPGGAAAEPEVPATPDGDVTVVGRVHLTESQSGPITRREGYLETRRVAVPQLADNLPYPVYGAYLLLETETPPPQTTLTQIPIRHENSWQNAGYVVQWWLFALMALIGFGWVVRREARGGAAPGRGTDRLGENPPAGSVSAPSR